MTRQMFILLILSSALTGIFCLAQVDRTPPQNGELFEPTPEAGLLPTLEDEKSPYFSRQLKSEAGHRTEDILSFRADRSLAHLFYGKNDALRRVEAYRNVNDRQILAYEADYDAAGRRVQKARYYGQDALLQTVLERQPDGTESYCFYTAGKLIQRVELACNGAQTRFNYENGVLKSTDKTPPPAQSHELFFWDTAGKQLRLRVQMLGARLAGFEYFERTGKLEHTGKVLADGSLEFSYLENGRLKRRQLWRLLGEDWERSYYELSYSELLADDGKTIEHKVWVHSNGYLKRHERYNAKSGKLEMGRDFDLEGRTARIEEFSETGQSKQVLVFPASGPRTRGFTPSGMRDYPGSDEKLGSVYDLDGAPFRRSVLDRHPWAFFQLRPDKTEVTRPTPPLPSFPLGL